MVHDNLRSLIWESDLQAKKISKFCLGELMDIRLNLTDQKNASSTSKDFYEESKQLMERELTGIREENGSVISTYQTNRTLTFYFASKANCRTIFLP